MIEVMDTGHGIPVEIQHKIFTPFFTTKEAKKGTGLGLSAVFAIVQRHQGMINVKSKEQHGTTISIEIPVSVVETS